MLHHVTKKPDPQTQSRMIGVLGAGGFLGSHLVHALLHHTDASLLAVDTSFVKIDPADSTSKRLHLYQASIQDQAVLKMVTESCQTVFSLTAICNPALYNQRPLEVIDANYTDLVPLIELCTKKHVRLIHFSTCEVYGKNLPGENADEPMQEDHSPLLLGPIQKERWTYACAKQLLERRIWASGAHYGLPWTIVRPFNVIGPRMDYIDGIDGEGTPRVLACFIKALFSGQTLKLVEGGHQRRSFIYIDDFIEAVLKILQRPEKCNGQIINLGNPANDVSIAELGRMMIACYQKIYSPHAHLTCETISSEKFYGQGYEDTQQRIPDMDKAQKLLAWQPKTSLMEMLPLILEDYHKRYRDHFFPTKDTTPQMTEAPNEHRHFHSSLQRGTNPRQRHRENPEIPRG